jgi:DNA-binding Lrp family transcriptional regulator
LVSLSKNLKDKKVKPNKKDGKVATLSKLISLDNIDKGIIRELVNDSNAKSSAISSKLNVPLSTIQRRRARLEDSILKKDYQLDSKEFGIRTADLLIGVTKGNSTHIAKQLLSTYDKHISSVSLVMGDPQINVCGNVLFRNSEELYRIVQEIKAMNNVNYVEWLELVKVIGNNNASTVDTLFKI